MKHPFFSVVAVIMLVSGMYTAAAAARLSIGTTPDGASVTFDTSSCGFTPVTVDNVTPGQHTVVLKKKGYYSKKLTITVTSDSVQALNVSLIKPGSVVVITDPPGARVFLENASIGVAPVETAKLKPGEYGLRVEKTHYVPVEQRIKITDGSYDTLRVTLSFERAYSDSLANVQKVKDVQEKKTKNIVKYAVAGLFAIMALVVIGFESSQP
jgi:hypothetical protein